MLKLGVTHQYIKAKSFSEFVRPLIPALVHFPFRVKLFNKSYKPGFILTLTQSPWRQWSALSTALNHRVYFNFSPLWPQLVSTLKVIKPYFILPSNITSWFKLFSSGSPYFISLHYTYRNCLLWFPVTSSWPIPLHYSHGAAKIISHFVPLIKYYRGDFSV